MKISKEDALFLHNILFHCSVGPSMGSHVDSKVSSMLDDLARVILDESGEEASSEEEESDEIETDDEMDEEPTPEAERLVGPPALGKLPVLSIVTPAGDDAKLEFEDVGEAAHVDALIDGGSVIIDGVEHIVVEESGKSIKLHDGEEWHTFAVKRLGKAWGRLLQPGIVFGVSLVPDEDEE